VVLVNVDLSASEALVEDFGGAESFGRRGKWAGWARVCPTRVTVSQMAATTNATIIRAIKSHQPDPPPLCIPLFQCVLSSAFQRPIIAPPR